MRLEVLLEKNGAFWLGEVPALDIMTQGRTKKEAIEMVIDAVETLVDDKYFYAEVKKSNIPNLYILQSNNQDLLIALLLRRQRQKHGLTLKEMAKRLGSSSVNSFARYEQGKASPTMKKLEQLMTAINPELDPIIRIQ